MNLWDEPLTDEQKAAITDKIATQVVSRGMASPAILFLEMHKPIARIAMNSALIFSPFIIPFVGFSPFNDYSQFLEDRENVERLIRRIEELNGERALVEKDTAHAAR